jgi:hypothetical protein
VGRVVKFETTPLNITFAVNRVHSLWHLASEEFGKWALGTITEQGDPQQLSILKERLDSLAISYIDTQPILSGKSRVAIDSLPKRIKHVAMLIPRKVVTDTVGDKRRFGRLAKQAGVEGVVVPRTFESAAEALNALGSPTKSPNSDLMFIKLTSGSGGKEVEPIATKDLAKFLHARGGLKRGELIQEGVEPLALHNGRKLVIRSYFIVYDGALYVCHHAGAIVHGLQFDSAESLYEVHVGHKHPDTIMEDLYEVTGESSGTKWMAAIIVAAKQAGPMFEKVVKASAKDSLRYHVFGVDVLPKTTGDVMFVESNIFPYVPDDAHHVRAYASVLRLLYGVQKGVGEVDDDLTLVWRIPRSSVQDWDTGEKRSEL